jgi:branched-chain amino acid transport system permease protein
LGGAGYLSGAIYGAATLLILEETLSPHTAYWQTVVGVCIVVVVLLGKHGIAGLIHGVPKPDEQT